MSVNCRDRSFEAGNGAAVCADRVLVVAATAAGPAFVGVAVVNGGGAMLAAVPSAGGGGGGSTLAAFAASVGDSEGAGFFVSFFCSAGAARQFVSACG